MRLVYVAPSDLHRWWPQIKDGIEECLWRETDDCWAEDVYAALRYGHAQLHVGLVRGDTLAGFVVTALQQDPWTGARRLHVWLCHNTAGHDVLAEGAAQLEHLARGAGATRMTFRADKAAFERLVRKLGFEMQEMQFVKEIE